MAHPLELSETQLRARRNEKWRRYGADILPAWVAEMDFAAPPAVQKAVERVAAQQDYGYPYRGTGDPEARLTEAFAARLQRLYGWRPDPGLMQFMPAFDQGISALLLAFTAPGDGVIVQTPCYPPFYDVNAAIRRRFIANPLQRHAGQWALDFADLENVAPTAKAMILCNPHNPTGRVFTAEELAKLADVAQRHDLIVIADEIHSGLIHAPHRHTPFASLGGEAAARCVSLNSASKAFNIPGLYCGVMHFGSAALAERYYAKLPRRLMGHATPFGLDAAVAAWEEGDAWLAEVLQLITARRDQLMAALAGPLAPVAACEPQGTYLSWLDLSALKLGEPAYDFLLREAKVAVMPGQRFMDGATDFVRLNLGTSEAIFTEILARMAQAIARR